MYCLKSWVTFKNHNPENKNDHKKWKTGLFQFWGVAFNNTQTPFN